MIPLRILTLRCILHVYMAHLHIVPLSTLYSEILFIVFLYSCFECIGDHDQFSELVVKRGSHLYSIPDVYCVLALTYHYGQ